MGTKEWLNLLVEFENLNKGVTYSEKDFALWLYSKHFPASKSVSIDLDRSIAYLVQRLGRLGKYFGKVALKESELKSIDEFTLLNNIFNATSISKNELYKQNVFELSSGTQIVKRLIEWNLIKEVQSPSDKRVTILEITDKGKKIRNKVFQKLAAEVQFKSSMFSMEEKKILIELLNKMDHTLSQAFMKES